MFEKIDDYKDFMNLKKYERITSNIDCQYLFYKTRMLKKENIKEALKLLKKLTNVLNKKTNLLVYFLNLLLLKLELENSNYKNFEKQIKAAQ